MPSIPSLDSLIPLFTDEQKCIEFLMDQGILYREQNCHICLGKMTLESKTCLFRCHKRTCQTKSSIRKDSFFAKSKLPCSKILRLGWMWLNKLPIGSICNMTSHSTTTVTTFARFYRELVGSILDPEHDTIRGDGVIVEIDESKFGKMKYHRGHRVDGVWVIGGIERTPQKKVFLATIENRNAETLLNVLNDHLLPGTIVHTDMWKAYDGIERVLGLEHHTVNHSAHFKDPHTGVHTNTIEGLWNGIKFNIKPRNRTKGGMQGHLMEFIWRRINKEHLWEALLYALKENKYE